MPVIELANEGWMQERPYISDFAMKARRVKHPGC